MNAHQARKQVRKVRAGQPAPTDTTALHRVDAKHLADNRVHMVAGQYEQRPLHADMQRPLHIDLAEPDEYEFSTGWAIFAAIFILAFLAFGIFINFY